MISILLSEQASRNLEPAIRNVLGACPYRLVTPAENEGARVDIAFISRDVTGASSKTRLVPSLLEFYEPLRASDRLAWVHTHSAGADRPIFTELLQRGVRVSTSSGANAPIVAQTALGAILAFARRFPLLAVSQRAHAWQPLLLDAPRPLAGQSALIVGYGPIGRRLATLLNALELDVTIVRREAGAPNTVAFDDMDRALPRCDWLILACPLTDNTRKLIDARRLALLPRGTHLINVARGEVVVEADVIAALQQGTLAGAYLDVFEEEPLDTRSPLWDLPNVIVSPHSAGHSSGNAAAVERIWLDNLARWTMGEPLKNEVEAPQQASPLRERVQ